MSSVKKIKKNLCLNLAFLTKLCYIIVASKKGLAADAGADGNGRDN